MINSACSGCFSTCTVSSSWQGSEINPSSHIPPWKVLQHSAGRKGNCSAELLPGLFKIWVLWLPLCIHFSSLVLVASAPTFESFRSWFLLPSDRKMQGPMFVRLTKCDYWQHKEKRAVPYLQNQTVPLHWLDLNACQESCGISIQNFQGRTNKKTPQMGHSVHAWAWKRMWS